MSGLDGGKRALLRGLFASVPDSALRNIEAALGCGADQGGALAETHFLAQTEVRERRARDVIFGPMVPMCGRSGRLPPFTVVTLWRALHATDLDTLDKTVEPTLDRDQREHASVCADALLDLAAERLADDDGPVWSGVRQTLESARPGAVDQTLAVLRISPLLRAAMPRLGSWVRTMAGDDSSALRLAYRDASEMDPPMGPLLVEALAAHLQQPWQVIRLLSAVMDRPSCSYLASSELGSFGRAVLDDVEARIVDVRGFDPGRGAEGGAAAAASVMVAAMQAVEFDQWIEVSRKTAWGRRLVNLRRELAKAVEARLREVEDTVAKALPLEPARGRRIRGAPKLDVAFDLKAAARAQGMLAFLDGVRTCAAFGGFAAVRSRVVEALEASLELYADDLIHIIHSGEPLPEPARARLDFAAECLGQVRDPAAGELVRRRAAVAA